MAQIEKHQKKITKEWMIDKIFDDQNIGGVRLDAGMRTVLKEALMSFSVTELKYFHFHMHIQFHVPDTKKNLEILKPTGYDHLIILYNLEDKPKAVQKEKITKWLTSALKQYEKEAIEFDDGEVLDEDILKMDKWQKKERAEFAKGQ